MHAPRCQDKDNSKSMIVGILNSPVSPINGLSELLFYKQNNIRIKWHHASNEPNRYLQNIPPITKGYTYYSALHGSVFKIDHTLEHKTSLNKFKKTEITPCILIDNNAIKLKISSKESLVRTQTHGN